MYRYLVKVRDTSTILLLVSPHHREQYCQQQQLALSTMSDNEEKVAEDGNEPITIRVRDQVRKLRERQTSAPLLCISFSGVALERLGVNPPSR
jgi:hypothetical protein